MSTVDVFLVGPTERCVVKTAATQRPMADDIVSVLGRIILCDCALNAFGEIVGGAGRNVGGVSGEDCFETLSELRGGGGAVELLEFYQGLGGKHNRVI